MTQYSTSTSAVPGRCGDKLCIHSGSLDVLQRILSIKYQLKVFFVCVRL